MACSSVLLRTPVQRSPCSARRRYLGGAMRTGRGTAHVGSEARHTQRRGAKEALGREARGYGYLASVHGGRVEWGSLRCSRSPGKEGVGHGVHDQPAQHAAVAVRQHGVVAALQRHARVVVPNGQRARLRASKQMPHTQLTVSRRKHSRPPSAAGRAAARHQTKDAQPPGVGQSTGRAAARHPPQDTAQATQRRAATTTAMHSPPCASSPHPREAEAVPPATGSWAQSVLARSWTCASHRSDRIAPAAACCGGWRRPPPPAGARRLCGAGTRR